jgi:3-deoxy-7-phosphoheptulonate synthase / chorismate mutase
VSEHDDPLAELRAQIGANDRAIVEAVNERLRLVTELWRIKETHGSERFDPDRERRLRDELAAANGGPLSAEGLDALVSELLALTKRELDR